jgi:hypothetical protein
MTSVTPMLDMMFWKKAEIDSATASNPSARRFYDGSRAATALLLIVHNKPDKFNSSAGIIMLNKCYKAILPAMLFVHSDNFLFARRIIYAILNLPDGRKTSLAACKNSFRAESDRTRGIHHEKQG